MLAHPHVPCVVSTSLGLALIAARAAAAPVGTARIEVITSGARRLPVQLWYPADAVARHEAQDGHALTEIEPAGPRRAQLAALLERAPRRDTTRRFHAALDAPSRAGGCLPLIVYSHGVDGTRFASLSTAERLAGAGFVVAAPDHEGGTLYDKVARRSVGLCDAFLAQRVADMRGLLDALSSAAAGTLPAGLCGRLDVARIGALGHSYGAATVGCLAQVDARVRAGATLAAPAAGGDPLMNALLPSMATLAVLDVPWLYMLGSEDLALYNGAIAQNFAAHPAEAVQVSLRDASHWSFTDLCGIVPDLARDDGVGAPRSAPPQAFRYLDVALARTLVAEHVTAFFRATLLGEGCGPASLPAHPAVTVAERTAPSRRCPRDEHAPPPAQRDSTASTASSGAGCASR